VRPQQILGGRYRLEEVVGVGGMSVVWRATDTVLARAVAVKILAGDFTLDLARAAVLAEAQAVAKLSHPNICNVFDYGESVQDRGHMVPYVVMELLNGSTLAERLKKGPLAPQEALKIAAEVAAGLATAHAHGVVHRDVKPGNVILTSSGAKVFDFGIAAPAGAPEEAGLDGHIVATPSAVAPERLVGGTVLPPSDMFAWGVLLFRMLTGKLPWPAWATLADRTAAAAPLPEIPGIPGKVGDLYRSCLAADPDERPTAAAAAAVLQIALAVRTPQPSEVVPRGRPANGDTGLVGLGAIADAQRRQRRRRVVLLLAGLVAVLALVAFALSRNAGQDRGRTPSQTTPPVAGGALGSRPPGSVSASLVAVVPGPAVTVRGIPIPPAAVTATAAGNPPVVVPATSFSTGGGTVVVSCETFGPQVRSIVAKPGFYPNEVGLIFAAFVFFTRPADGVNPSITYRLTITCSGSGSAPNVTVASYQGEPLGTPAATASP
jgi:serine/threonine-protein kinase